MMGVLAGIYEWKMIPATVGMPSATAAARDFGRRNRTKNETDKNDDEHDFCKATQPNLAFQIMEREQEVQSGSLSRMVNFQRLYTGCFPWGTASVFRVEFVTINS